MDSLTTHIQRYLTQAKAYLARAPEYLNTEFWRVNGIWRGLILLAGARFFPRLTVLLYAAVQLWQGIAPFKLKYVMWIGVLWLNFPRFIVAFLMYDVYGETNPELGIFFALTAVLNIYFDPEGGTDIEKKLVKKLSRALSDYEHEIKVALSALALIIALVAGILLIIWIVIKGISALLTVSALPFLLAFIFLGGWALHFFWRKYEFWYGVCLTLAALVVGGYTLWSAPAVKGRSLGELVKSSELLGTIFGLVTFVLLVAEGLRSTGGPEGVLNKLKSLRRE